MISFGRVRDLELIGPLFWMFRVKRKLFPILLEMIRLITIPVSYTQSY